MRLSQKLLLFVLAAAVVPLAFAGFWLLREAERELGTRLEREQRALASAAAESAGTQLASSLESLAQSASLIEWSKVSPEEAVGGLQLLASQSPAVVTAALHVPARPELTAFIGPREERPQVKIEREALLALLPLSTLGAYGEPGQLALGPAQDGVGGPWMPAAIQVGPKGPDAPMVVLGLTLQGLSMWLYTHAPPSTVMELVDADGRVIASSVTGADLKQLDATRLAALQSTFTLTPTEQIATEKVPGKLGLTAVVSVPLEVARAPVNSLRQSVLGGMGITVLLLVLVSILYAGRLAQRLQQLSSVAEAFARGELNRRVQVSGGDELTQVGTTFNEMGAELESSRARLMTWNDELKRRVEEATAELRAAQAQLLETQKLAAIGQLGAGVAHEINNPLVGILGNAQLMLMDAKESDDNFSLLKQIEESAQRCREITQQLLRFSQKRGEVSVGPMDLNALVTRVVGIERGRDATVQVEVQQPPGPVRIDGDSEQLEQILAQLCTNARTAMKSASEKKISFHLVELHDGASLTLSDTGKGIPPENLARVFEPFFTTKDVWTNIGLGLAVAYRVMQEHGGSIAVASEPGKGAQFTLLFKSAGSVRRRSSDSSLDVGGQGKGITG